MLGINEVLESNLLSIVNRSFPFGDDGRKRQSLFNRVCFNHTHSPTVSCSVLFLEVISAQKELALAFHLAQHFCIQINLFF